MWPSFADPERSQREEADPYSCLFYNSDAIGRC
jgi:hypothetical protein